ncbi:MAG: hypothetical protein PF448_11480 [Bacteroidales bacterium]|nr:hypothetical protein [Bacteroidales bacterium]
MAQSINPRSTTPKDKWDRRFPEMKIGDKIYQTGSNWLTADFGVANNYILKQQELSMAIAYHIRYKPVYFKFGYHYSDETFFLSNRLRNISYHNDIIAAAGLRYELRYFNLAFFIGPSFAFGMIEDPENPLIGHGYRALGAVPELQLTYKFFYDIGIGTSLYGSFNKHSQAVGIRLHIYFSGAYRGVY